MEAQLKDKVAIVTGATQGLGKAVALLFAERGAAGLMLAGRSVAKGEEAAAAVAAAGGGEAAFCAADVSRVADCRALVAACLKRFGRVDVLVNVAACTERGSILDTSEELFDRIFATNVKGPFFLMQEAAKAMRAARIEGAIVNIGSAAALSGQPFIAAYCASKGALEILTKNTAFALLPDRIRVNCLNIGWMATEGEDRIQRRFHGAQDGWLEAAAARQPFGRLVDPAEVAKAAAFAASSESGLMTGAAIYFDQTVPGAFMTQPLPERLAD